MPKYKVGDYFLDGDGRISYEIKSVGEEKYELNFEIGLNFFDFDRVERVVSRSFTKKSKYRKNNKLNRKLYPNAKVIDEDRIEVGYEL